MKHAAKIDLKIDIGTISLCEENKLVWSNSYEKADKDRLAKSPAAAKNAPDLPSVNPSYYVLNDEESDFFIQQLPSAVVLHERPIVICNVFEAKTPSQLCVHKDFGRVSSINVYLKSSGEVTSFYNFDKQSMLLTLLESFCAKTNETWVMCSKTPHGVVFPQPTVRTVLNYSFKRTNFQQLLELL